MENTVAEINNLILELSLATCLPTGTGDKEEQLMRASAAANAMASRTKGMPRNELRDFEWTIRPLLDILILDLQNPVAAKTALTLRTLMASRVCMSRFLQEDGLVVAAKVMDILLAKKVGELKTHSTCRSIVEHLAVCYREIARFYQWRLVDVGGIRHCVLLLRFGDIQLQTITAATLASLSSDLEICKQMFSYGAIKPLILASDGDNTNEACMLAGLGCITQLCRIPEIGVRMVQQGAVQLMEKGILRYTGHGNQAIREKALHTLGYLAEIPQVKSKICTPLTLRGIYFEFHNGTMPCRLTILQLLMNVHLKYKEEKEFVRSVRDEVLRLLKSAPWSVQNLCVKVMCVLYRTDEDRMYFAEHGVIETLLEIIESKNRDLQEAPIVLFLNLCSHTDLPPMLLERGVQSVAADMLKCDEPIIKELAVILLKALLLYNHEEIEKVVPTDMSYILVQDVYNPQKYGSEYGGMIQEFLQEIVQNRHDQDYLLSLFTKKEIRELELTDAELEDYQLTFMELDVECRKYLGVDELKLLMVLMGERMDKDEIQDLLEQYDTDKSGNLDFKEFVIMMKGWETRFGTGLMKFYRIKTQRGAIGKARRAYRLWAEKGQVEAAEVQQAKERIKKSKQTGRDVELQFLEHERMKERREHEMLLRAHGMSQFTSSQKFRPVRRPPTLPPVSLRSPICKSSRSPSPLPNQSRRKEGSSSVGFDVSSSLESLSPRTAGLASSRSKGPITSSRNNYSGNPDSSRKPGSGGRIETFSPSSRTSGRSPLKKSVRLIGEAPLSSQRQQQQRLLLQTPTDPEKRSVGFVDHSNSINSFDDSSHGDEPVGFSTKDISAKYSGAFSPVNPNIQRKRALIKAAAAASAKNSPITPSKESAVVSEKSPMHSSKADRRGGLLNMGARAMVPGSMINADVAANQEAQQLRAAEEELEVQDFAQKMSSKNKKSKKSKRFLQDSTVDAP